MFARWGTFVHRKRVMILILGIAFTAFASSWGIGAFDNLDGASDLDDPASESQLINQRVTDELGRQGADLIALYSSDDLTVDSASFEDAVVAATDQVAAMPEVDAVIGYYDTGDDSLVSSDEHATYVLVRFDSSASVVSVEIARDELVAPGVRTQVGGPSAINLDIDDQIGPDIARAEMIALPLLLIALLFLFGNVVAALMPLLVGTIAIMGAFSAVRVITMFTDVSPFAINIITVLGLGLAVDYGLFMVSRFREELDRGQTVAAAISRTMATAGRTIAVSGVIVGLSLSSLLVFPQVLLRSMGLGGAAAVLLAMVIALTVLPAMLALLGPRIDAGRVPRIGRRTVPSLTGAVASGIEYQADTGWWARVARSVMRRPVMYAVGVFAILLVLAAPLLHLEFGGIDERMLPAGTESRVVSERLAAEFPGSDSQPIRVLVSGASLSEAERFADQIAGTADVRTAEVSANGGTSSLISVTYDGEANSEQARTVVDRIRADNPPTGADVLVGGATASIIDQLESLNSRLPWMALLVAGITFVLLAIAFGSLVVPVKAILMNLVSIGAAFGVVTWIFQDGHLSGLLGFTPTGYVEASQAILMVAILFGLSMDYEVFLLSRIRERWDVLGDNTAAVAGGVQRTGGIITAAALLLCIVVGAFATSGITFIKMIGVGMFVALIVDATLVRLLLVPATMRLLGRHNWWAPGPVRRLYGRYGMSEDEDEISTGITADSRTADRIREPAAETAGAGVS